MKPSLIQKNMNQQNKDSTLELIYFLKGEHDSPSNEKSTFIIQNNAEINATILKASDRIYDAISHPHPAPLSQLAIVIPVLTGLVVASAAFIYNKIHWASVKKRERKIKKAETIIELVTTLDELAVDYWVRNYAKKLSRDNTKCEIKIKSHLGLINTLIPSLCEDVGFRQRKKTKINLIGYHSELYDIITGDDFESTSRKSDVTKASKIANKCLKLRVELVNICI